MSSLHPSFGNTPEEDSFVNTLEEEYATTRKDLECSEAYNKDLEVEVTNLTSELDETKIACSELKKTHLETYKEKCSLEEMVKLLEEENATLKGFIGTCKPNDARSLSRRNNLRTGDLQSESEETSESEEAESSAFTPKSEHDVSCDMELKLKHLLEMITRNQEQVDQVHRKTIATFHECQRASGLMVDICCQADKALVSLDNLIAALSSAEDYNRPATGPFLASETKEDFSQSPYRNAQVHREFKEQSPVPNYFATPNAKQVVKRYGTPEKTHEIQAGDPASPQRSIVSTKQINTIDPDQVSAHYAKPLNSDVNPSKQRTGTNVNKGTCQSTIKDSSYSGVFGTLLCVACLAITVYLNWQLML